MKFRNYTTWTLGAISLGVILHSSMLFYNKWKKEAEERLSRIEPGIYVIPIIRLEGEYNTGEDIMRELEDKDLLTKSTYEDGILEVKEDGTQRIHSFHSSRK